MSQRDDYEHGVPCWVDTLQPDPDTAMAFLFGWTTETFGEGMGAVTMSATDGDAPSHWSINFCDHDADATTAKALELGGSAIAPPFDTPISRTAVLADLHGGSFSISNVPGRETELR